jgi:hypothetical protein
MVQPSFCPFISALKFEPCAHRLYKSANLDFDSYLLFNPMIIIQYEIWTICTVLASMSADLGFDKQPAFLSVDMQL